MIKFTVFWNTTLCNLYASSSETQVLVYQITGITFRTSNAKYPTLEYMCGGGGGGGGGGGWSPLVSF